MKRRKSILPLPSLSFEKDEKSHNQNKSPSGRVDKRTLESLIKTEQFEKFEESLIEFQPIRFSYHKTSFSLLLVNQLIYRNPQSQKSFSEEDCLKLLKLCINKGEDLDIIVDYSSKSLLMIAVENDLQQICDLMLEQPYINLTHKNSCQMMAIDYAAIFGRTEIFKKLYNKIYIEKKYILREEQFYKIFDEAIMANNIEIVMFLLDHSSSTDGDAFFLMSVMSNYKTLMTSELKKLENKLASLEIIKSSTQKSLPYHNTPKPIDQNPYAKYVYKSEKSELSKHFFKIKDNHEQKFILFNALNTQFPDNLEYFNELKQIDQLIGQVEKGYFDTSCSCAIL
jgi:hypothetical protein